MKLNKKIDAFFEEKFKDFEVNPPESSWDYIEKKLQEKKKKRIIVPFWLNAGKVAAVLVVGGLLIYFNSIFNTSETVAPKNTNTVVNQNKTIPNNKESVDVANDSKANDSKIVIQQQNKLEKNSISNKNTEKPIQAETYQVAQTKEIKLKKSTENTIKENKILNTKLAVNEANKDFVNKGLEKEKNNTLTEKNIINENKAFTSNLKNNNDSNLVNNTKDNNSSINSNSSINKDITKDDVTKNTQQFLNQNARDLVAEKNKSENNNANQNSIINQSGEIVKQNIANNNTEKINDNSNKESQQILNENTKETAVTVIEPKENIQKKDLVKEALKKEEKKEKINTSDNSTNWAVNAYASPVFYNTFIKESIISEEFQINEKLNQNAVAYGVGLSYKLSKNVNLKAGLSSINLDYKTENVSYANSVDAQVNDNVSLKRNANSANLILMGKSTISLESNSEIVIDNMTNKAAITQNVSYIELPLELSYAILNKKFSIQLKGGFSTLFLTRNDVFLRNNNDELMNIGQASNLNSTHFTGNVGLGLNYEFLKNISLNIDPIARYQINPFNKTSTSNPFLLGVNTGLSYRF